MELKTNVVKTWWEILACMDKKPSIVYKYVVAAESEDAARLAAADGLPRGFSVRSITPTTVEIPTVDLTEAERI